MNPDAVSIRRFMWLLDQRGYRYATESDLDSVITIRESKRPDFWVDTGQGVQFLAEVKSFEKRVAIQLNDEPRFVMFVDDGQRRINAQPIEKAAQQLAPYRADEMPLIVVLDNHRQVGVSLGTLELIQIFGSLQYEITVDTASGRTVEEGWGQRQSDRGLGGQRRPYISAVIVNIPETHFNTPEAADDFSTPRPMRIHAIHNPDATNPLPLWVFSGPTDKQIIQGGDGWIEWEGPPIVGTAWSNGSDAYGIRIGREDRDRHFQRAWGVVTLLVRGHAPITANIDKDSFWLGSCVELIGADIKRWFTDARAIPWRARTPPTFALIPAGPARFVVVDDGRARRM